MKQIIRISYNSVDQPRPEPVMGELIGFTTTMVRVVNPPSHVSPYARDYHMSVGAAIVRYDNNNVSIVPLWDQSYEVRIDYIRDMVPPDDSEEFSFLRPKYKVAGVPKNPNPNPPAPPPPLPKVGDRVMMLRTKFVVGHKLDASSVHEVLYVDHENRMIGVKKAGAHLILLIQAKDCQLTIDDDDEEF